MPSWLDIDRKLIIVKLFEFFLSDESTVFRLNNGSTEEIISAVK
jgi:hypothetical protein